MRAVKTKTVTKSKVTNSSLPIACRDDAGDPVLPVDALAPQLTLFKKMEISVEVESVSRGRPVIVVVQDAAEGFEQQLASMILSYSVGGIPCTHVFLYSLATGEPLQSIFPAYWSYRIPVLSELQRIFFALLSCTFPLESVPRHP